MTDKRKTTLSYVWWTCKLFITTPASARGHCIPGAHAITQNVPAVPAFSSSTGGFDGESTLESKTRFVNVSI